VNATDTTKAQNEYAADAIDEAFGVWFENAEVVDYEGRPAIKVEHMGLDAVDVSQNATVWGALPEDTFLEPINSGLLRLVRA
jgi:hypothetical protein